MRHVIRTLASVTLAFALLAGANAVEAASSYYPQSDGYVVGPFQYTNVAAGTATTVIKSNGGVLHSICVNTKGASSNVLTIYDNTSAASPLIATMDDTTAVACQIYDVAFQTGLTVKSTTGTGADLTITFL